MISLGLAGDESTKLETGCVEVDKLMVPLSSCIGLNLWMTFQVFCIWLKVTAFLLYTVMMTPGYTCTAEPITSTPDYPWKPCVWATWHD